MHVHLRRIQEKRGGSVLARVAAILWAITRTALSRKNHASGAGENEVHGSREALIEALCATQNGTRFNLSGTSA